MIFVGRPKKKAQANGNKKSDGKTDKSSKSTASGHHHTHGHHHRHRSNSDSDNNTDSNNKTTNKQSEVNNTNNAKPRAKTVKTPPTKFRSTGNCVAVLQCYCIYVVCNVVIQRHGYTAV